MHIRSCWLAWRVSRVTALVEECTADPGKVQLADDRALWQAARAISACNALTWLSLAGCTQVGPPVPR